MAPGKPRVQFRVMEGAETLGLRALRREFGLYGEAGRPLGGPCGKALGEALGELKDQSTFNGIHRNNSKHIES